MKLSTIFRRASKNENLAEALVGCCGAINIAATSLYGLRDFSRGQSARWKAQDFFRDLYRPRFTEQPYWMGDITPGNVAFRQTALLFAAAVAESEGL